MAEAACPRPVPRRVLGAHRDDALVTAARRAGELGLTPRLELISGDPCDVIVALADAEDVDLIVLGPGQGRDWTRPAGGAVARRVLRCANRPVLLARERAGERLPYRTLGPVALGLGDIPTVARG